MFAGSRLDQYLCGYILTVNRFPGLIPFDAEGCVLCVNVSVTSEYGIRQTSVWSRLTYYNKL